MAFCCRKTVKYDSQLFNKLEQMLNMLKVVCNNQTE